MSFCLLFGLLLVSLTYQRRPRDEVVVERLGALLDLRFYDNSPAVAASQIDADTPEAAHLAPLFTNSHDLQLFVASDTWLTFTDIAPEPGWSNSGQDHIHVRLHPEAIDCLFGYCTNDYPRVTVTIAGSLNSPSLSNNSVTVPFMKALSYVDESLTTFYRVGTVSLNGARSNHLSRPVYVRALSVVPCLSDSSHYLDFVFYESCITTLDVSYGWRKKFSSADHYEEGGCIGISDSVNVRNYYLRPEGVATIVGNGLPPHAITGRCYQDRGECVNRTQLYSVMSDTSHFQRDRVGCMSAWESGSGINDNIQHRFVFYGDYRCQNSVSTKFEDGGTNSQCGSGGLCLLFNPREGARCTCYDAARSGLFCYNSARDEPFLILGLSLGLTSFFGSLGLLLCSGLVVFGIVRYRRRKTREEIRDAELEQLRESVQKLQSAADSEINWNDLELEKLIGRGGSGCKVYVGSWSHLRGSRVAVKVTRLILDEEEGFLESTAMEEFRKEFALMLSLHHPNVLTTFGYAVQLPRIAIVMEFCSHGDWKSYLEKYRHKNGEGVPYKKKLQQLCNVASAMDYLHAVNVLHRDLKVQNILIHDDNATPRIMDFGLSRRLGGGDESKTKGIGTSFHMAPEIVLGIEYDSSIDVFAFAMMAYVVLTENSRPLGEGDFVEYRVANDPTCRPDVSAIQPSDSRLSELLSSSWSQHPSERPTFSEICTQLEKVLSGPEQAPTVVYLRESGRPAEDAVDVVLRLKTYDELLELIRENLGRERQVSSIVVDNADREKVGSDNAVLRLRVEDELLIEFV